MSDNSKVHTTFREVVEEVSRSERLYEQDSTLTLANVRDAEAILNAAISNGPSPTVPRSTPQEGKPS